MKNVRFIVLIIMLLSSVDLLAQKTISEGTIVYDIVIETGNNEPQMADALDGATTTVYLKSSLSRTDMKSVLGNETTIYDSKAGNAVIYKEYSGQKLMITLTKENWAKKNKKYEGITFELIEETKTIAGYNCKKAIAKLKDGSSFTVYYSPDLTVSNKEYDQAFKTLPGLAMQYEYEAGKFKFKYTASKIDLGPVSTSKFEISKAGYRVMTYEESLQAKKAVQ